VRYRLQRSTDGGTTWVDVRGGSAMGTQGVTIVDDYEYAPNQENQYRIIEPVFYDSFNRAYPSAGTLQLTGAATSNATTPDDPSLDIVGDLDLMIDATSEQWVPSAQQGLIGKWVTGTNNRSYLLTLETTGRLKLWYSTLGTDGPSATASLPIPISSGRIAIRVTMDTNNGVGQHAITFMTASGGTAFSAPWTQLGDVRTVTGTANTFAGTAPVEIGSYNNGNNRFTGQVHAARIRNGIGGPIVANPFFSSQAPGTMVFVDSAGRTWTLGAAASIITIEPVPGTDWGTADTGHVWNVGSTSAGYNAWVNNGVGVVRSTQPAGRIMEQVTDPVVGLTDGDITWSAIFPGTRASMDDSVEWGVGLRSVDFNNMYESNIRFRPEANDYAVELRIGKFIADVYTQLGTTGTVGTWTPGIPWHAKFRVQGTSLAAKIWQEGANEPTNWSLFVTDTSIVAGTGVNMRSFKGSGDEFEQWFGPIEAHTIPPTVGDTAAVTPEQPETFLKSITYPLLNRELECVDWDALDRDSRAGFFDIKGRHEILAIADVGSSGSFTLTFVTQNEDTLRGIRSLLTYGGILYLQPPGEIEEDCPTDYSGIPDGYVMWDGHEEAHSVRGTNIRGWTVGMTRVAAVDQAGVIPTTMTWQMLWDMIGPDGTWETVWATWPTWQDLWLSEGSASSFGSEVL
jgi:hypothetical protein